MAKRSREPLGTGERIEVGKIAREIARAEYQRPLLKLLGDQQRLEREVYFLSILDRTPDGASPSPEAEAIRAEAIRLWKKGKRVERR